MGCRDFDIRTRESRVLRPIGFSFGVLKLLFVDFPETQIGRANTRLVESGHIELESVFEIVGERLFLSNFGGAGVQDADNALYNLSVGVRFSCHRAGLISWFEYRVLAEYVPISKTFEWSIPYSSLKVSGSRRRRAPSRYKSASTLASPPCAR